MQSYKIVRFFEDGRNSKTINKGLTLEEAQAHCQDPSTRGVMPDGTRWFDGYTKQN